ncbi:NACHT domain- and WD repeat-containing protein 1 [Irineochytrium annulatum]|nr:NACHT domain- and WD repeat-containing protein 1 [Irineochytrium annulatum]
MSSLPDVPALPKAPSQSASSSLASASATKARDGVSGSPGGRAGAAEIRIPPVLAVPSELDDPAAQTIGIDVDIGWCYDPTVLGLDFPPLDLQLKELPVRTAVAKFQPQPPDVRDYRPMEARKVARPKTSRAASAPSRRNQTKAAAVSTSSTPAATDRQQQLESEQHEQVGYPPSSEQLLRSILRPESREGPAPLSYLPPAAPGTAHRRYTALQPCANRLLAKKWDDAARERHRQKLATIKTYVDSRTPKKHSHLKLRLKRLQLEEEHLTEIHKNNVNLLNRMTRHMSAPQGFSGLNVDNTLKKPVPKPRPNERKKRDEKEQLEQTNLLLMQRVEAREANYHAESWEEERRTNLGYFQRITRFPEGYEKVLNREGVPPPLKPKNLEVRMTRGEMLKKAWYSQAAEAAEPEQRAEKHVMRRRNPDGKLEPRPPTPRTDQKPALPVHDNKSEKLRKEYIQVVSKGKEGHKLWFRQHGLSTTDPLDVVNFFGRVSAMSDRGRELLSDETSRSRSRSRSRSESPSHRNRLAVRANRAQMLRIEDRKREMPAESFWHPAHLENVETRIDFGQGGWSSGGYRGPSAQRGEMDREAALNATSVDETDFEAELGASEDDVEIVPGDDKIWAGVLMGSALRTGVRVPAAYPTDARIYWSSDPEGCEIERAKILSAVQPSIKEAADVYGIQILFRDLKWGVSRQLADTHQFHNMCREELDVCLKVTLSDLYINVIALLGSRLGGCGGLPTELTGKLHDTLLAMFCDTSQYEGAASLLERWYRLDSNAVPAQYVVQPISALIPDFLYSTDPTSIYAANAIWSEQNELLLGSLKKAAFQIMRDLDKPDVVTEIEDVDIDVLEKLTRRFLEEEMMRSICSPTENAILICRQEIGILGEDKNADGHAIDWDGDHPDAVAQEELQELQTKLMDLVPTARTITERVQWTPGIGLDREDITVQQYAAKLSNQICLIMEQALEKIDERINYDPVLEEVLHHTRYFRENYKGYIGRHRTVHKVVSFLHTRYRYGVPPLFIHGPRGTGKTYLMCHALKRYLVESSSSQSTPAQPSKAPSNSLIIVRFVGLTRDSSTPNGLVTSICRQIRRANAQASYLDRKGSSLNLGDYIRIENSSPMFEPDYLRLDATGLQSALQAALATATARRPIVVVILGLDKLSPDDSLSSSPRPPRMSWLPIETMPPNAYIAATLADDACPGLWESCSWRLDATVARMAEQNMKLYQEFTVPTEHLDVIACQLALLRWMRAKGRTLTPSQRRSIVAAVTTPQTHAGVPIPGSARVASSSSASSQPTCVTPWLMRLHCSLALATRSWDLRAAPVGPVTKVVDHILSAVERAHGLAVVNRAARVLCLVRDGCAEAELEDLLSIDREVVTESACAQVMAASAMAMRGDFRPLPRVSAVVVVALLRALTKEYPLCVRVAGGGTGGRGPMLLRWSHESVRDAAMKRYLGDMVAVEAVKNDIANYFSGFWRDRSDGGAEVGAISNVSHKVAAAAVTVRCALPNGMQWKMTLHPHAYLPEQYTCLTAMEKAYNTRKIRELPRMLLLAQKWGTLVELFHDYMFLEGLLETQGIDLTISEAVYLLQEGQRMPIPMPPNLQLLLRHLIIFLRHRSSWAPKFESGLSVRPPGMWLQEFQNLPKNYNTISFADPIAASIDSYWPDILKSRAGRIVNENGWCPDEEPYGPVPFRQITVQCCCVSDCAKYLAAGSSDGAVRVWCLVTGDELAAFTHANDASAPPEISASQAEMHAHSPQSAGVTAIGFSHERPPQYVVSASHDPQREPSIRLWCWRAPQSAGPPKTLTGMHAIGSAVVSAEFQTVENRRVVSIGTDLCCVLWEVARCRMIRVVPVPGIDDLTDGNGAAHVFSMPRSAGGAAAPSWNIPTNFRRKRAWPSGWTRVAGCTGPGGMIAFGSASVTVMNARWKTLLCKNLSNEEERLRRHRLTSVAFSADGANLFVSSAVTPDDVQMLCVEMQLRVDKSNRAVGGGSGGGGGGGGLGAGLGAGLNVDDGLGVPGGRRNTIFPIASEAQHVSDVGFDLKWLRSSAVRGWNIETGQQVLLFMVEDYVHSIALTYDGNYVLTAGQNGAVCGWSRTTGLHEFTRESHAAPVLQIAAFPQPVRNVKIAAAGRRKGSTSGGGRDSVVGTGADDDSEATWIYSTSSQSHARSLRKKSRVSTVAPPGCPAAVPVQLLSISQDGLLHAWSIDAQGSDVRGLTPVTSCRFSDTGEWILTVGGGHLGTTPRPNTLVRLWETATATVRCRIELPETQRSDVVTAMFLPGNDTKVVIGCRNGLVRLYKSRNGELLREFWTDIEVAYSVGTLEYVVDWPFAITGTSVVAYALHPNGRVLAVAVAGQEPIPTQASTVQDPKVTWSLEASMRAGLESAGMADLAKVAESAGRKKKGLTEGDDADRSGDMALRDVVRVIFWDIEDGNPYRLDPNFSFPLFFNASDHSCAPGPRARRPRLDRLSRFALEWSKDGRCLLASDDMEIMKECHIEIRGRVVYGTPRQGWWWRCQEPPPPSGFQGNENIFSGGGGRQGDMRDVYTSSEMNLSGGGGGIPTARSLAVSGATSCRSTVSKETENLVFSYGDGVIGWKKTDTVRGREEMHWFLGHCEPRSESGGMVGCDYVPDVAGRDKYEVPPKYNDPSGVVISASRNGTIMVQDCYSKEICAVTNAGNPIRSMSVNSGVKSSNSSEGRRVQIAVGKADGSVALFRFYP